MMDPTQVAAMLVAQGEALYDLSTAATPRAMAWSRWMREPRLGDIVLIEHVHRDALPLDRVGRLDGMGWREGADGVGRVPHRTILTLDGREVVWEDCLVLRLPESPGDGP